MAPPESKLDSPVVTMESQLALLGSKLQELADHAAATGDELKHDYRKRVQGLKAKHQRAQVKFDICKAAGADKWDTLKEGMERAWRELKDAFDALPRKH